MHQKPVTITVQAHKDLNQQFGELFKALSGPSRDIKKQMIEIRKNFQLIEEMKLEIKFCMYSNCNWFLMHFYTVPSTALTKLNLWIW